MAKVVDDVVLVSTNPPTADLSGAVDNRDRIILITQLWTNQLVFAERFFCERMAFFRHGHLCSELDKVHPANSCVDRLISPVAAA